MEEQARGRLEKMVEEEKARNKAELESLRSDMVACNDPAEEMEATRREAVKERQRFRATAYKLENEALSLGEEVRMALKKEKSLTAAELRSVQKLLKKTVKTAKSASTWGEPEKETMPPPPPPPGSQEGEAPEETDAPEEVVTPEASLEKGKQKEGGPPRKPPKKTAQASNPDDGSSLSSSSSDRDDTRDGNIESLLRHRRQARLRKKGKEAFMMDDLSDVERDKKKKKLQIPKPDT